MLIKFIIKLIFFIFLCLLLYLILENAIKNKKMANEKILLTKERHDELYKLFENVIKEYGWMARHMPIMFFYQETAKRSIGYSWHTVRKVVTEKTGRKGTKYNKKRPYRKRKTFKRSGETTKKRHDKIFEIYKEVIKKYYEKPETKWAKFEACHEVAAKTNFSYSTVKQIVEKRIKDESY